MANTNKKGNSSNSASKGNSGNTNGGTETSFQNTPQAKDDVFGTLQSGTLDYENTIYLLNVMVNDLGGNAKSLWSVDDGVNDSGAMSGHEAGDLLTQDLAGVTGIPENRSKFGAALSVTADGRVAYDTSTIDAQYAADLTALALGDTLTDSFIYAIRLASGTLSWAKASVVLTGVNDTPVVQSVALAALEDGGAVSGAFDGDDVDSDDDGNSLTYSIIGAPDTGALVNNGDGTFTYDPGSNFQELAAGESADFNLSYTATDSHGAVSVPATLSITVTGVNDAPTLATGSLGADEDGAEVALDLAPLGDDIDSDDNGSSLTYTLLSSPPGGTATIMGTTLKFNPGSDFQALAVDETTSFDLDVQATDSHGATVTNKVTITVTGTNDAPTVSSVVLNAVEDGGAVSGAFIGADIDSDDDGSTLAYSIVGSPGTGTLDNNGDGTFTFDPGTNFQSLALGESTVFELSYTATDSNTAVSDPAMLTINVTGVNDAPTLAAGSVAATEDGPGVTLDLSALGDDIDSDDNGNTLSYTLVGPAPGASGTATISGSTLNYNPESDFQSLALGETRDVVFNVKATDTHGASVTNEVTVTVTGTNDEPIITGASNGAVKLVPAVVPFTVQQWTNYSGAFDLATLKSFASNNAANYTVTTDVIDYTDDPLGFAGEIPGSSRWPAADATNSNGTGGINDYFIARITSTISITETDTYTFRTFNDDGVYVYVDNQLIINDSGIHPEASFSGSLLLNPGVYPVEIFFFENNGEASLEFTYKNSTGIYQHVNPSTVTDTGVLQFSDVDLSDTHAVSVAPVGSTQGSLTAVKTADTTGTGTGGAVTWNYEIDNSAYQSLREGATTVESFIVSVDDGKGGVAQQQLDITVTGGNDAPTASNDSATTDEDNAVTISVLANDTDPDIGDAKFLQAVSTAQNGTVQISGENIIYTPAPNFNGNDSFTYTMRDDFGATSTATVDVTVNAINDGPVINFLNTTVTNGSFESGLSGWSSSEINFIGDWQAANGTKLLDMNAEHGGGYVEQSLQTIIGAQYTVGFALSKNPGSPTGLETLRVTAAGQTQDYAYNQSNTSTNMQWSEQAFTFTANSTTTTLRLASADATGGSDAWGPALDNVRLLGDISAFEDTATTIKGLSVSDVDAGSNAITLGLTVNSGTLTITGSGLSGDLNGSDGTLSITGSQADINAALANGLVYKASQDYFGADTLSVTLNDQGHTGAGGILSATKNIAINVVPVNDAPTISFITPTLANGSFEQAFNSSTDWTATGGGVDRVTHWQAGQGTVSVDLHAFNPGGIKQSLTTFDGMTYVIDFLLSKNTDTPVIPTATVRVAAGSSSDDYTFATANSASNMNWRGESFLFTASGATTELSFSSQFPTSGAKGPAIDDVKISVGAEANSTSTIKGLSIADIDAGTSPILLSLSVDFGTLDLSNIDNLTAVDNDGSDGSIAYMGTLAAINAALQSGVNYTADELFEGFDTLTALIDDLGATGGGSLTDSEVVQIQVIGVAELPH